MKLIKQRLKIMSHFTYIKTRFQNRFNLEKALAKLNVTYERQKSVNSNSEFNTIDLIIPQSNGYDIKFISNGQEYELITDLSFWQQPYSVKSFMDKLSQKYAGEVITNESQKIGFQTTKYKQNLDGSDTLILERWVL